jgi:hypothetical protein
MIYTVDINTKKSGKVVDILNQSGYSICLSNNKIFYTNHLDPGNIKLYSWDMSEQTCELVKDSLINPHLSKKYLAYIKTYLTIQLVHGQLYYMIWKKQLLTWAIYWFTRRNSLLMKPVSLIQEIITKSIFSTCRKPQHCAANPLLLCNSQNRRRIRFFKI